MHALHQWSAREGVSAEAMRGRPLCSAGWSACPADDRGAAAVQPAWFTVLRGPLNYVLTA